MYLSLLREQAGDNFIFTKKQIPGCKSILHYKVIMLLPLHKSSQVVASFCWYISVRQRHTNCVHVSSMITYTTHISWKIKEKKARFEWFHTPDTATICTPNITRIWYCSPSSSYTQPIQPQKIKREPCLLLSTYH